MTFFFWILTQIQQIFLFNRLLFFLFNLFNLCEIVKMLRL